MINEIQEKFRDRFIATANQRVARARDHIGHARGAAVVNAELHSLAGEAAMLGFADIAKLSRSGEQASRDWIEHLQESARQRCAEFLDQLETQLAELSR